MAVRRSCAERVGRGVTPGFISNNRIGNYLSHLVSSTLLTRRGKTAGTQTLAGIGARRGEWVGSPWELPWPYPRPRGIGP